MFTHSEIELLKTELKRRYGKKYISSVWEESKLSKTTISTFFNHKSIDPLNAQSIYDLGIDMIESKNDEHKKRIERIESSKPSSKAKIFIR